MTTVEPPYPGRELKEEDEHYPPDNVRTKLSQWADDKNVHYADLLKALRWDGIMRCWCFTWAGMFVGVEKDGHIHT